MVRAEVLAEVLPEVGGMSELHTAIPQLKKYKKK